MVSDVSVTSRPEAKQVDRTTANYRVSAWEDSVVPPTAGSNLPPHPAAHPQGAFAGSSGPLPIGDGAGFIRALRRHHWIIETTAPRHIIRY